MNYTLIALIASLVLNIALFFVVASLLDRKRDAGGNDDWPVGV